MFYIHQAKQQRGHKCKESEGGGYHVMQKREGVESSAAANSLEENNNSPGIQGVQEIKGW